MSNLDDVLAKAKAQSEALAPLAPLSAPSTAVASSANYDMGVDSFLNAGGMEVEAYVQVKDAGIKLDKSWNGYIDDFTCEIDLNDVQFFMGVRKEVGTTVTYAKTYDGRTTIKGEPFAQIAAEFKRDSQKPAEPYRGADIPMKLLDSYADPKKTGKALEADAIVGLSTSITGFKPWASFHKKLVNAGHGTATIKVKVTHSPRKNAANQAYGVCEFELLEIVNGISANAA